MFNFFILFITFLSSSIFSEVKIYGGKTSEHLNFMVSLHLKSDYGNLSYPFCGGFLVSHRHIVTAAHCVDSLNLDNLYVRLSAYTYDSPDLYSDFVYNISEINIHPYYENIYYDIAVLEIEADISSKLSSGEVGYIQMNDDIFLKQGDSLTVVGFGYINDQKDKPDILQAANIEYVESSYCSDLLGTKIWNFSFCAGKIEGLIDSCQGDSGGPAFIEADDNKKIAYGIVSWGIGCALYQKPGVYTDITYFKPWITSIIYNLDYVLEEPIHQSKFSMLSLIILMSLIVSLRFRYVL